VTCSLSLTPARYGHLTPARGGGVRCRPSLAH
jgi:hypothetical protein